MPVLAPQKLECLVAKNRKIILRSTRNFLTTLHFYAFPKNLFCGRKHHGNVVFPPNFVENISFRQIFTKFRQIDAFFEIFVKKHLPVIFSTPKSILWEIQKNAVVVWKFRVDQVFFPLFLGTRHSRFWGAKCVIYSNTSLYKCVIYIPKLIESSLVSWHIKTKQIATSISKIVFV